MTALSRNWLLIPALLLAIATAPGCTDNELFTGEPGYWTAEDPDRWPRVAMVSRIRYSDSNHPMAGSAFLLDTGDEIVAVTAKHVLRYFKSEAMDSVSFRGTLESWEMFPKDAPDDVTVVGALINENADEPLEEIRAARDWLLFTVERASASVKPLPLRTAPLEAGETVFVVGWRYTDEGRQHVYPGRYVRSEDDSVLIDVKKLTNNKMPGLSGAPVIDARGHVVGMMSSGAGKLQRLAPIDYPRRMLDQEIREERP